MGVGGAFTKLPQAVMRFALATGSPDVTVKISLSRELLMQAGGEEEGDRVFPTEDCVCGSLLLISVKLPISA